MKGNTEPTRARSALILVTLLWGSTFVVIHGGLAVLSPFVLIAFRFLLAGLTLALLRPKALRTAALALPRLLPLSAAMFAGFSLQTIGLQTTTPARSAFITSLSVILVPVFDYICTRTLPAARLLLAVTVAAAGVYILFKPIGLQWHTGDTWTFLSAIAFAYYIVELARTSRRFDTIAIVLVQCFTIGFLASLCAPFLESPRLQVGWQAAGVIAYLGIVCTGATFLLMTWGQARIGPIEAGIIYILEPVFAAAFSIALGREAFSFKLVLGGSLIVAAMLLSWWRRQAEAAWGNQGRRSVS